TTPWASAGAGYWAWRQAARTSRRRCPRSCRRPASSRGCHSLPVHWPTPRLTSRVEGRTMNAGRASRAVLLFPAQVLKALVLWPCELSKAFLSGVRKVLLSPRTWVLFILLLIVTLVAYYVLSDRYTPLTTDAYVQAHVVQVAPRVEGQVVHVYVQEGQAVSR